MRKSTITNCLECNKPQVHAHGLCSSCHGKWYHANNLEKRHTVNKKWRENNKEHNKERWKKWASENEEYLKQKQKDRWTNNKAEEQKRFKNWRETEKGKELRRRAAKIYQHNRRGAIGYLSRNIMDQIKICYPSCAYCGSMEKLTIEHIKPVANGGTNDIFNLCMACNQCNSSKQNFDMLEWLNGKIPHNKIVMDLYYIQMNGSGNGSLD